MGFLDAINQARTSLTKQLVKGLSKTHSQRKILVIEDRVPHNYLGAGYPRSNLILTALVKTGFAVTLYPLVFPEKEQKTTYLDIPSSVEVMFGFGAARLKSFLLARADYYDFIIVSRPHNMAALIPYLPILRKAKIIYDAEALFCLREIEMAKIRGAPLNPAEAQGLIDDEIRLAEQSFSIISVSSQEARRFSEREFKRVHTLGYAVEARPTSKPFCERKDILFVGPLNGLNTPNTDAVRWFIRKIFPTIQESLGQSLNFLVAGQNDPSLIGNLAGPSVKFLGTVADLTSLYDSARLFVGPTRFSAGIPLKLLHAAAHGLPIVGTDLLANQLEWTNEIEMLTATDEASFAAASIRLYQDSELWQRTRDNALRRVRADCAHEAFINELQNILVEATAG